MLLHCRFPRGRQRRALTVRWIDTPEPYIAVCFVRDSMGNAQIHSLIQENYNRDQNARVCTTCIVVYMCLFVCMYMYVYLYVCL